LHRPIIETLRRWPIHLDGITLRSAPQDSSATKSVTSRNTCGEQITSALPPKGDLSQTC
jgi:hypothetical protein